MMQYIMENMWLLWAIVAFICLILELSAGDFYVTCFAVGALVALVSSLFGWPLWVQIVVFAVCSVLSIWFLRPKLTTWIHPKGKQRASNADALIGRMGVVTAEIEAGGSGYVKIDGDEWKAFAADGNGIAQGTKVRIEKMESTIVTVTPCEK